MLNAEVVLASVIASERRKPYSTLLPGMCLTLADVEQSQRPKLNIIGPPVSSLKDT